MGQESTAEEVKIDPVVKVEEDLMVSGKKEVSCLLEDGIPYTLKQEGFRCI